MTLALVARQRLPTTDSRISIVRPPLKPSARSTQPTKHPMWILTRMVTTATSSSTPESDNKQFSHPRSLVETTHLVSRVMWTRQKRVFSTPIKLHPPKLSGSLHPRTLEPSMQVMRHHRRSQAPRSQIERCRQAGVLLSNHPRRMTLGRAIWLSAQEGTPYAKVLSLDRARWTLKASQRRISHNLARVYHRRTSINRHTFSHPRAKSRKAKSKATASTAKSAKQTKTSSHQCSRLRLIKTQRPSRQSRGPILTLTWPTTTKRHKEWTTQDSVKMQARTDTSLLSAGTIHRTHKSI